MVLPDGETLIGRAPSCDIVIIAPGVSRQHARLKLEGGLCLLSDVGSRYGTELNGSPMLGETALKAGDVFRCGQVTLSIEQRVESNQLLSEDHQLLEDSGTLVRELDPGDARGTQRAHVATAIGTTTDRAVAERAANEGSPCRQPSAARARSSDRDATGASRALLRLLSEISKTLVTVQPLPQILTPRRRSGVRRRAGRARVPAAARRRRSGADARACCATATARRRSRRR